MTKNEKRGLTAIDLFSGCGGMSLGLKQAGFNVVAAVELDELAAETYRRNHKNVMLVQRDVRRVSPLILRRDLGLKRGQLDLLAGCPPCQGFSSMTTKNGGKKVTDPRNDLVFEMIRFAKEFEPRAVMLENVPALRADQRFASFLRRLRKQGYKVSYEVLDASKYGVPQRRKRLVLLASKRKAPEFARPSAPTKTVRNTISALPKAGASGDPLHDVQHLMTDRVATLIRSIPSNGGSRNSLPKKMQLKCHKTFDGFKDVYGRMTWDEVAPTITSGCINPSKGRFLHPKENRAITLREAALLQTFPRKYYFSMSTGKYNTARMIGNALPPEFVRRQALSLKKQVLLRT
jgi:DNA (cytosine-5)-methyltransferase 1